MAKNYSYAEAVAIIAEGKNLEAITDLGRRYPVLVQKTTVVVTKAGEAFTELMSFMPEYLTANKLNGEIKKLITGTDTDGEDAEANEASESSEAPKAPEVKTEKSTPDYDSMNAKQLWDILGEAGKRGTTKSKKKEDLLAAVKAMIGGGSTEKTEEPETDEESKEIVKYEGKSAVELFKECKKRNIKAEPKKPAKYYAELLTKADAEAAAPAKEEDDWDEEEPEVKKPVKEAKKPAKDEEDNWDI